LPAAATREWENRRWQSLHLTREWVSRLWRPHENGKTAGGSKMT